MIFFVLIFDVFIFHCLFYNSEDCFGELQFEKEDIRRSRRSNLTSHLFIIVVIINVILLLFFPYIYHFYCCHYYF